MSAVRKKAPNKRRWVRNPPMVPPELAAKLDDAVASVPPKYRPAAKKAILDLCVEVSPVIDRAIDVFDAIGLDKIQSLLLVNTITLAGTLGTLDGLEAARREAMARHPKVPPVAEYLRNTPPPKARKGRR